MKLNVIVEIPRNSKIKYEYNRATKEIVVDRILYGSSSYPLNYGFIKEALDWDGDELDALIVSDQEFLPGAIVPTRLLGAMEMIDGGEVDTKLICVIDCDPRYDEINTLKDLPQHTLLEIKDFFENYKNLQKKEVEIQGFKNKEWAVEEYKQCVELMNKYGKMKKSEFILEMKRIHPNKYK